MKFRQIWLIDGGRELSVSEPILILKLISAVKGHRLRRRSTSRHTLQIDSFGISVRGAALIEQGDLKIEIESF
jgi:hypothetical protein